MSLSRWGVILAVVFAACGALLGSFGPQLQRMVDPNYVLIRAVLKQFGVGPEYEADLALEAYARTVATAAYLYGTSIIEMAIAEHTQTSGYASDVNSTHGSFAHFEGGQLPSFNNSWLSGANPDALFSSCWLFLGDAPVVLHVPPVPEDIPWFSIQVEDYYGRNVGYISTRSQGQDALQLGGRFLLEYSSDCRETIQSYSGQGDPQAYNGRICVGTNRAWVLVRIASSALTAQKYHMSFQRNLKVLDVGSSPEEQERGGKGVKSVPKSQLHVRSLFTTVHGADAKHFRKFSTIEEMEKSVRGSVETLLLLTEFLAENNPSSPVCYDQPLKRSEECEVLRDDGLMHELRDIGLYPEKGLSTPLDNLYPSVASGIVAGAKIGDTIALRNRMNIQKLRDFKLQGGWAFSPKALGRYKDDYFLRSMAKRNGIGANNPEEAVYPTAFFDEREFLLDGHNNYQINFNAAVMDKAASTFWSLTAYDRSTGKLMNHPFAIKNDQYSVSTLKGLKTTENGEIQVRIQFEQPSEVDVKNWLPVLRTGIYVICRLYGPSQEALNHAITMPPIQRVRLG